ncbi:MAG: hypothetical protein HW421_2955 [Ignavibacteria bacterium]|nr:hypothetical protein [Ignavibacteria bacterium]
MQQYSIEEIKQALSELDSISNGVQSILNETEKLDFADLEKIFNLYAKKQLFFEKLQKFQNSPEYEVFMEDNKNFWEDSVGAILKKEESNLTKLEFNMKSLSEELRQFLKKKSVLIYAQENKI